MPSDLRGDSRRQRRPDLIAMPPLDLCLVPEASDGACADQREMISPTASPPWSARRRAARFSPACHYHRGDEPRRLGFWPSSASAPARRSSPSTTSPITRRSAGRSPTCSPASARNARIAEAGLRLAVNAERHLKTPAEMARLFAEFSRRHRPHDRHRQSLQLLARRTEIRISRRAGAGGQNRAAASGRSHLGGRTRSAIRRTNIRTAFPADVEQRLQ